MLKSEIRKNIKELKRKLSKEEQDQYSNSIVNCLVNLPEYHRADEIFCYVNFNQEVKTKKLIEKALSEGKMVAVPKVMDDDMNFFYISSLNDLEPGVLGIPEPVTTNEAIPNPNKSNLFLVPGLAFDLKGNRIGYGKGYYDRYFKKYNNCPINKIALTYDFQVLSLLPAEEQDIQMDQIITEKRLIKVMAEN